MHAEYKITVQANGRVVLPIKIREQMGIETGDQLLLVWDKDLKITPLKESVRQIQQKIKKHNTQGISLVDSLKQTRLTESKHE
ncbi:MAG: AbrB/MazE/SpoVT family DNA-binding domain-containing protein [Gammaproteobacteria bacterium]|nr:AbrB/MazE/SpoVT family DNA-binding domain-containing protein [Gammaproteobacteria bacterium]